MPLGSRGCLLPPTRLGRSRFAAGARSSVFGLAGRLRWHLSGSTIPTKCVHWSGATKTDIAVKSGELFNPHKAIVLPNLPQAPPKSSSRQCSGDHRFAAPEEFACRCTTEQA